MRFAVQRAMQRRNQILSNRSLVIVFYRSFKTMLVKMSADIKFGVRFDFVYIAKFKSN